jgi:hypothetical protein
MIYAQTYTKFGTKSSACTNLETPYRLENDNIIHK